jgi:hypothetical protein
MVRYVSEEPVMRNAEEFSGQRSGLARVLPTYCRPRSAAGGQPGAFRIRYAHRGALPGDEPFRTAPQGPADYHGTDGGTGDVRDLADGGGSGNGGDYGDGGVLGNGSDYGDGGEPGNGGDLGGGESLGTGRGSGGGGDLGEYGSGGDGGGEGWLTEFPAGKRHGDLWVLVCGGIAAAAAFAAAFVASGGVASHPAAPGAGVPAVVSQACPAPAAVPTP